MKTIKITKKDFVSKPYSKCPKCGSLSLGFPLLGISHDKYSKECFECDHEESYDLPEIKKKIIYLDQFAIDNIVKTLDSKHPKHESVAKDPFWLQLYERLDKLSKAQIIVCPDSFYHLDESAPTYYFDSMQRIYEHLSGGVTFFMEHQIIEEQVCEHFENYLKGTSETPPTIDPEKIVYGDLYEWSDRMRMFINKKKRKERLEEQQKASKKTYEAFVVTFKRWQTETGKKFEEYFKEEMEGFAKGTVLAAKNHYLRKSQSPQKYLQTGQLDINDILPPPSAELLAKFMDIARKNGAKTDEEIIKQISAYLFSEHLNTVPVLRIGTALYAAIAHQASHGRTALPSPGINVDVKMISSLLPYCDAMLIDKENAGILADPQVKKKIGVFSAKIFAPKDRVALLDYLDGLIINTDPKHIAFVKKVYGDDWIKPYTTILNHSI